MKFPWYHQSNKPARTLVIRLNGREDTEETCEGVSHLSIKHDLLLCFGPDANNRDELKAAYALACLISFHWA